MPIPDPDAALTADATNTLPVEVVDTTPVGDEPASNLPAAVEAAVETTEIASSLTADLSGASNY